MPPSGLWKTFEREAARLLQKAAGPVRDPQLKPLVTKTGRVGHIGELGFDILVGNGKTAIAGEAKRRDLPKWLTSALRQIVSRAVEWKRTPVLVFQLKADDPKELWVELDGGGKTRMIREWALVPLQEYAALVEERRLREEQA